MCRCCRPSCSPPHLRRLAASAASRAGRGTSADARAACRLATRAAVPACAAVAFPLVLLVAFPPAPPVALPPEPPFPPAPPVVFLPRRLSPSRPCRSSRSRLRRPTPCPLAPPGRAACRDFSAQARAAARAARRVPARAAQRRAPCPAGRAGPSRFFPPKPARPPVAPKRHRCREFHPSTSFRPRRFYCRGATTRGACACAAAASAIRAQTSAVADIPPVPWLLDSPLRIRTQAGQTQAGIALCATPHCTTEVAKRALMPPCCIIVGIENAMAMSRKESRALRASCSEAHAVATVFDFPVRVRFDSLHLSDLHGLGLAPGLHACGPSSHSVSRTDAGFRDGAGPDRGHAGAEAHRPQTKRAVRIPARWGRGKRGRGRREMEEVGPAGLEAGAGRQRCWCRQFSGKRCGR